MKKRWIQIVVTLVFSAVGLYLALRGVDFSEIGTALSAARWDWIALGALCMVVSFFLRGLRWRVLLEKQVGVLDAFGLINVGYLISGILPLRLGDPARGVAASLRSRVTVMAALSTVVIERALDLITVVLFLVLTLPTITVGQSTWVGLASGAAALILMVALALMARFPEPVESLARAVLERLPLGDPERWLKPLRDVLEGLQVLRSPRKGVALVLYSLGIWAAVVVYYWVLQQALLHEAMPDRRALLSLVTTWATALGMAVPSQGGIGGYHATARWALAGFGVDEAAAATYAIVAHAISYFLGIVLGAGALLLWGISIRELVGDKQEPPSHT